MEITSVIIVVTVMAVVFVVVLILAIIICRKWQNPENFKPGMSSFKGGRHGTEDEVFIEDSTTVSDNVFTNPSTSQDASTPKKPTRRKTMPAKLHTTYENVEVSLNKTKEEGNNKENNSVKPVSRHKSLKVQMIANHKENYENVTLIANLNNIPLTYKSAKDNKTSLQTTIKEETAV